MTTTLVTGGNGFIGRATVSELLKHGRKVIVLDPNGKPPVPGATVYLGDIKDDIAVTEAMAHSDSWIHLGGVLGTQETIFNPRPAAYTNVLGGLNVLEAATQYNLPGVNIAVGNWWMNNTYSITKNTVERFAEMFRDERDLQVTTVRGLNVYGPGQSVAQPYGESKVRKIMPAFICRALTGTPIEVYGDGNQIMDMIYIEDIAKVLVRALIHTEVHGAAPGVVEAGNGLDTTVLEIAQEVQRAVEDLTGSTVAIKHLPMRPGETAGAVVKADTSTLSLIGASHTRFVSLGQGIHNTVQYFQDEWLRGWLDDQR
jgi:UDP-glucose 4-epimerase